MDEASALLHRRDEHDGLIKSSESLSGFLFSDDVGGSLSISGLLAGDEETTKFVDVSKSKSELLLSIGKETVGVSNSLLAALSGTVVELDLRLVFWEKLIALSSLHVVGSISLGLFVSDLLGELVDKSEDITDQSVSGEVKLKLRHYYIS